MNPAGPLAVAQARLPRHMAALNAIAERCGLSVKVVVEPYEDEKTSDIIFSRWSGTKEQLFAVGLFTSSQQRLPINRGAIIVPSTINWNHRPLLRGYISVEGSKVIYEVDFGPVPAQVVTRGDLEVCMYENGASYHGPAESLIHQGVCEASQLPLGKKRWNRDHPHGIHYEGPRWYSRRQPDGTILHWLETEAARQKRLAEWNEQMGAYRARTSTAISPVTDVYGTPAAGTPEKPRANHLRLVVSNGHRKEPQS